MDINSRYEIEKQRCIDCHLRGIAAIHRSDYKEMDLCLKDAKKSLVSMQNMEVEYKIQEEIRKMVQGISHDITLQNIVNSIEQDHQNFMRSRI